MFQPYDNKVNTNYVFYKLIFIIFRFIESIFDKINRMVEILNANKLIITNFTQKEIKGALFYYSVIIFVKKLLPMRKGEIIHSE